METYKTLMPDVDGFFGTFGGRFVAETLMPLLLELDAKWQEAKADSSFWARFELLCRHYVGRPSPLYRAERLSASIGGARIYLKRDELNHTGSHTPALDQSRLVLRLWPTDIGLADTAQTPIWVGSIVVERLSRHLSLFTSVATGPDVNTGRDTLASELPDGKLVTRSDGAESSNWDGRALLLRVP